jgi:hypothetical protein
MAGQPFNDSHYFVAATDPPVPHGEGIKAAT